MRFGWAETVKYLPDPFSLVFFLGRGEELPPECTHHAAEISVGAVGPEGVAPARPTGFCRFKRVHFLLPLLHAVENVKAFSTYNNARLQHYAVGRNS